MKDDYTTNSRQPHLYIFCLKGCENVKNNTVAFRDGAARPGPRQQFKHKEKNPDAWVDAH